MGRATRRVVDPGRPTGPGWDDEVLVLHADGAARRRRCGAAWYYDVASFGAFAWVGPERAIETEAAAITAGLAAAPDGAAVEVRCDNLSLVSICNEPERRFEDDSTPLLALYRELALRPSRLIWTPSHRYDTVDEHRVCDWLAEIARRHMVGEPPLEHASELDPSIFRDVAEIAESGRSLPAAFVIARKNHKGRLIRDALGLDPAPVRAKP